MNKTEAKPLSFELHEDMLITIAKEFDTQRVVEQFSKRLDEAEWREASEEVFGAYGRNLAHRALELGEEYSDRTYELMLEMVDKTGAYRFPLLPQRFLEIAYLSTQDFYAFPVRINSNQILRFEITDCKIFNKLAANCPKSVIEQVPCKAADMALIENILNHFRLDVQIEAKAAPLAENRCIFSLING